MIDVEGSDGIAPGIDIGPGPGLLVSVRSPVEAREAVLGGASVVDVKEPDRGPLGCADPRVWRLVRAVVPASVPVSVALGELRDWIDLDRTLPGREAFEGISYRKVGLAGLSGAAWPGLWSRFREAIGLETGWVAVAYLDFDRAGAPSTSEVRDEAIRLPGCVGVLIDTWDKSRKADLGAIEPGWFEPIRRSGRFVALAGGLDVEGFGIVPALRPDLIAVRGAACEGGDRRGSVDRDRVRRLVGAARRVGRTSAVAESARASIG